jgi:hypothetical protein
MPPPGSDELSPEQKLDDIHVLGARSTADPDEVPVPAWHRALITERLATVDHGEGSARPWNAVRQDLLAELRDVRR